MSKAPSLILGLLLGGFITASLPLFAQTPGSNQAGAPGLSPARTTGQKPKSGKQITVKFEWVDTYNAEKSTRSLVLRTMDGVLVKSMDMGTMPQIIGNSDGTPIRFDQPAPRRSVSVTPDIGEDGRISLDITASWPTYAVSGSPASYSDREFSTTRAVAAGETVVLRQMEGKYEPGGNGTPSNFSELLMVTVTVD